MHPQGQSYCMPWGTSWDDRHAKNEIGLSMTTQSSFRSPPITTGSQVPKRPIGTACCHLPWAMVVPRGPNPQDWTRSNEFRTGPRGKSYLNYVAASLKAITLPWRILTVYVLTHDWTFWLWWLYSWCFQIDLSGRFLQYTWQGFLKIESLELLFLSLVASAGLWLRISLGGMSRYESLKGYPQHKIKHHDQTSEAKPLLLCSGPNHVFRKKKGDGKKTKLLYFERSPPWHVGWRLSGEGCHWEYDGKNGEFENIDFRFPWLSDTSEMGFGHDVPFLNYSDRLPHPSDLCQPDRVRWG